MDNLTVIDCSVLDPDRGLIGASWAVDVELMGELDQQSMVFDFARVKKVIKKVIDNEVDHKLLIPIDYEGLDCSGRRSVRLEFRYRKNQFLRHTSPASALCRIPAKRVSRESVEEFVTAILLEKLPDNVQDVIVNLHEEQNSGRYYCYSHGLKKHDGNCQRIAHGHRSQIQIWKNGRRSRYLERDLARKWEDIYLGTTEDVINYSHSRIHFEYTTSQGHFKLELPEEAVHLMNCDSTVECIAEHILDMLLQDMPNAEFKVKAFEGMRKGAIAQSEKR